MKNLNKICETIFRPACLVYLFICMVAFAISIWADNIFGPNRFADFAPLAITKTLFTMQAGFFILIYPAIIFARTQRESNKDKKLLTGLCENLLETAGLLLLSIPLYVLSKFYSDSTVDQILRGILCLLICLPISLSLALAMRVEILRPILLAIMFFASGANVCAEFFITDFFPNFNLNWLITFSPVSFTWIATGEVLSNFWSRYIAEIITWLILSIVFVSFGTLLSDKQKIANK